MNILLLLLFTPPSSVGVNVLVDDLSANMVLLILSLLLFSEHCVCVNAASSPCEVCLRPVGNSSFGRLSVVEFVFLQSNFIDKEKRTFLRPDFLYIVSKQILSFYAKFVLCLCPLLFLYLPLSVCACARTRVCVCGATLGCYHGNSV